MEATHTFLKSPIMKVSHKGNDCFLNNVIKQCDDQIWRCIYSGETIQEIIDAGYIVYNDAHEGFEMIAKLADKKYIGQWDEISEEEYFEKMNCLPPQRWENLWGLSIFHMSEAMTDDIYGFYIDDLEGKFYTAFRRTTQSNNDIAVGFIKQMKGQNNDA